jgi:hypothetical protein
MTREETNNKNKTSVQNTTFCNDLSLSFEDEYVAEPLCVYSRFSQFVETKDYARIGSWNNGQLLLLSRLQSHHPIIPINPIPHIKKPVSRIICLITLHTKIVLNLDSMQHVINVGLFFLYLRERYVYVCIKSIKCVHIVSNSNDRPKPT